MNSSSNPTAEVTSMDRCICSVMLEGKCTLPNNRNISIKEEGKIRYSSLWMFWYALISFRHSTEFKHQTHTLTACHCLLTTGYLGQINTCASDNTNYPTVRLTKSNTRQKLTSQSVGIHNLECL